MASNLKEIFEQLSANAPSSIDNTRAIVVLESKDLISIIKYQLHSLGLTRVISFSSGHEACHYMEEFDEPVSMTICAHKLPDMYGYEYLNEMQENPNIMRTPFLEVVQDPTREKVMFALEKGIDDVLGRPFASKDLFAKLQKSFVSFHRPDNIEKIYDLVLKKILEKDLEFAEKILHLIYNEYGESNRYFINLARLQDARGQYAQAIITLRKSLEFNDQYIHAFALLGEVLAKSSEYAQATEIFLKAIELSPLNPVRYEKVVDILNRQDRPHEVIKIVKKALTHNVETPDLLHALSQSCMQVKSYEDALRYIRMALRVDGENIHYLNQLGICLRETGDLKGARSAYNTIIKLDSSNNQAHYNKAVVYKFEGNDAKAIEVLEKLLEREPEFKLARQLLRSLRSEAG